MQIQEQVIAEIAKEVVARLRVQMQQPAAPLQLRRPMPRATESSPPWMRPSTQPSRRRSKVAAMSLEDRGRMIEIVRRICNDRREELGRMELEETKVGRLDHKDSEADEHAFCARR
jgi:uncharacterized membrane protein